jgi:hypothetical protein
LDGLLNVVLHLVAFVHVSHQLSKHQDLFFSLAIFQEFLLFGVSLKFEHFNFFFDCFLFISVGDLNVLMSLSLLNSDSLKSCSELIKANEALDTLLS